MEEGRFKLPKIERPSNPLTPQGVKALVIVLAVIFLISAIVYFNITRQKKEISPVLPATTTQEVTTEPELTPTPMPEETPASPAGEPTATVSPTATESVPTD